MIDFLMSTIVTTREYGCFEAKDRVLTAMSRSVVAQTKTEKSIEDSQEVNRREEITTKEILTTFLDGVIVTRALRCYVHFVMI